MVYFFTSKWVVILWGRDELGSQHCRHRLADTRSIFNAHIHDMCVVCRLSTSPLFGDPIGHPLACFCLAFHYTVIPYGTTLLSCRQRYYEIRVKRAWATD
jgi:hypothetical protein